MTPNPIAHASLSNAPPAAPDLTRIDRPGHCETVVEAVRPISAGVISLQLGPASPATRLPRFDAGAHIDLHLPGGLVRSYSLHNAPEEADRYAIGVLNDSASRGGSRWIHEHLRVGDRLTISAPRNNFRLDEQAERSVFVAGGIGVTPILSMLRRLVALGKTAHVIYCARSRASAPFVEELALLAVRGITVHSHFDDEAGVHPDLRAHLSGCTPQDHFYCCGPAPMLQVFESSCQALGFPHVHVERFKAETAAPAPVVTGRCTVELRQSGIVVDIPKNAPALQSLLAAGIEIEYSCEEGVCGACETRILEGEADHRDSLQSTAQKAAQRTMMVCVSRCRSDRMVLDL